MCKGLTADNAKLVIYDPKVMEAQIHQDLATPKFEWDHPQSSGTKSPRSSAITVVGDAYTARTRPETQNPRLQPLCFSRWTTCSPAAPSPRARPPSQWLATPTRRANLI